MIFVPDDTPPSDFADWEPLDSYTPPGDDLSPLAVARRLHEERVILDVLAGNEPVRWIELTDDERIVAVHLMVKIVAWLRLEGVIGPRRGDEDQASTPAGLTIEGRDVVEPERRGIRGLVDRVFGDDD